MGKPQIRNGGSTLWLFFQEDTVGATVCVCAEHNHRVVPFMWTIIVVVKMRDTVDLEHSGP